MSESNLDEMEAEILRNKLYKVTTIIYNDVCVHVGLKQHCTEIGIFFGSLQYHFVKYGQLYMCICYDYLLMMTNLHVLFR